MVSVEIFKDASPAASRVVAPRRVLPLSKKFTVPVAPLPLLVTVATNVRGAPMPAGFNDVDSVTVLVAFLMMRGNACDVEGASLASPT